MWIGDRAFLGSADLAGTLMVGPAVKSIGTFAFANTKLTGLVFGVSPPVSDVCIDNEVLSAGAGLSLI